MTQTIVNIIIVLFFSAFFSGIEVAFRASNKLRAELDRHNAGPISKILSRFYANPNDFISAMLVGNFISLVIYALLMAGVMDNVLSASPSPILRHEAVKLPLQILVTAAIVIVTGEFLPKTLFKINPNRTLSFFAVPALLLYWVLYPVAKCVNAVSRGLPVIGYNGEDDFADRCNALYDTVFDK